MRMSDDVIRMQQEAANRVARMQEQSRRLVADHPPPLYGGRRESAPQAASIASAASQPSL